MTLCIGQATLLTDQRIQNRQNNYRTAFNIESVSVCAGSINKVNGKDYTKISRYFTSSETGMIPCF
jgi:hypothetical protein